MGVRSFFSFKNQHTLIFFILMAMLIPTFVQTYAPSYKDYAAYGAVGFIIALLIALPLNARLQATQYPHIQHTFCIWPSMVTFDRDLYIDMEELKPAGRVPNIWPLMKRRIGADGKPTYEPLYVGGRFYWIYLAKLRWERDIPSFGDCLYHIFIFTRPWNVFLNFTERPDGAYFQGETLTLSASEHLESIMFDFKTTILGMEIPTFYGVSATYTRKRITATWEATAKVIARYLGKMPELLEQEKQNIWPNKTLEEMLVANLPEEAKVLMTVKKR